jgi:hypothetical protein
MSWELTARTITTSPGFNPAMLMRGWLALSSRRP